MTAKKGGEKVWQIGKGKINEWRWRTGLGRDDDMKEKIKERRTRNWRRQEGKAHGKKEGKKWGLLKEG
jgi:hypothetical protein